MVYESHTRLTAQGNSHIQTTIHLTLKPADDSKNKAVASHWRQMAMPNE